MKQLGYGPVRQLLRHEAGEANRFLVSSWEWVQLVLALSVLGMLFSLKSNPPYFAAAGLALLLTLANHFLLTPEITAFGRALDFVPAGAMIAERSRFASMERIYSFSHALVMLLSAGLLAAFLRRTRSRRLPVKAANQINTVNYPDNAHIDR